MITVTQARDLFVVDASGKLLWAVPHGRWNHLPAGVEAGCLVNGYRRVDVGGVKYFAHHIVWLMTHGVLPSFRLDHENGNRDENLPLNLRPATAAQNNQNHHGLARHNTSGMRGVSWDASRQKWTASISLDNRRVNLGRFDSMDAAHEAYRAAKRIHHPFSEEARS